MNFKVSKFDIDTIKNVLNDLKNYCWLYGCSGVYEIDKNCPFWISHKGCMFDVYKTPENWNLDTHGKNIQKYNSEHNKEILGVLQYIKDYCKEYKECSTKCQFWGVHQEECGFCLYGCSYKPQDWDINDIPLDKILHR